MSIGDCFPRSNALPKQSPLFWVAHKDRYLRQLLISDIEQSTKRALVVYFTDCDHTSAQIDQTDDVALFELLQANVGKPVDLLLETNGGLTDATEKICSLLRQTCADLRVIVPRRAKSNGTVIALCGAEVLMGYQSELGPIDPHIGGIPCEFIVNAPAGSVNFVDFQYAQAARSQTRKLASALLSTGMMSGKTPAEIEDTVNKLATKVEYHSHGSSIDADEAIKLQLKVQKLCPTDELWQRLWLLRTMYQHDCQTNGYAKVFESSILSTSTSVKPKPPSSP